MSMVNYSIKWGNTLPPFNRCRVFLAPDNGDGQGSGAANAGNAPADPYADVPWDELDDGTRKTLETARDAYKTATERAATLEQTNNTTLATLQKYQQEEEQRRQQALASTAPKADPMQEKMEGYLKAKGYTPEQVKLNAGLFAGMFQEILPLFRDQIGRDLGPLAATVVGQQTKDAFEQAQEADTVGMFQHPEVAQAVWDTCQAQAAQGQALTADAIQNLAKMTYFDKVIATGKADQIPVLTQPPTPRMSPTPPPNRSTGFTFPGARTTGRQAPIGTVTNGAPIDSDTMAALQATFNTLAATTTDDKHPNGIRPKLFQKSK